MEAITACDKRIDYLVDFRETGRIRLEKKTRTSGKDMPPANHHAPAGLQRLFPRKKGRLSRGILSTETETDATSKAEGLIRVRDRPQGRIAAH